MVLLSDGPSELTSRSARILSSLPAGEYLAAALATIDVESLPPYDRIETLKANARMTAFFQARMYEDMTAVADAFADEDLAEMDSLEAAASEIRVALNLTRRSADHELSFAHNLRERLPRVLAMLRRGDIDVPRARVMDDGTLHLTEDAARAVVDEAAPDAPSMTTGQLKAHIRKLCIDATPHEAEERYEFAVENRRIVTEPDVDGTANLMGFNLPPDRVMTASRRVSSIARSLKREGENRTIDQLRADVFLDILEGRDVGARIMTNVHITADMETLAGLANHSGELNGFGPVISDISRQVADGSGDSRWSYAVTDPSSSALVDTGTTRRRPSASQHRRTTARDSVCVFPGCRMPAIDCDIDHIIEYSDNGPTVEENLAPLCRHDHRLKSNLWTYERLPDGTYEWTSPIGHTYTTWQPPP